MHWDLQVMGSLDGRGVWTCLVRSAGQFGEMPWL
jgi:hypothetical protein